MPRLAGSGIAVIVDGAHAPGQIELDVGALVAAGVSYYAGNHHKWLCGPKASGFLVAAPDVVARTRPLVTSHGASPDYGGANRYHAELDWPGTHDPSPHLAVPAAIDAIAALGGGWPAVVARNHALAIEMRARFADVLGRATGLVPADAIGAMCAMPIALPAGTAPLALETQLLEAGWEVPIIDWPGGPLVRVSAHLYNDAAREAATRSPRSSCHAPRP